MSILYIFMIWLLSGWIIYFLHLFLYFRGIEHYMKCKIWHPKSMKSFSDLWLSSNGNTKLIGISLLILYSILPIIGAYYFLGDMWAFSTIDMNPKKEKSNE